MENQRVIRLRTMPYEEYLKTPEWLEKRDQVLERDGRRCRNCNSGENLHVHHRTYARRGYEDLNDLTTLCQPCHEHFHKRMRSSDSMYEERRESNPRGILSIEERAEENARNWEYYLIGLLLRNATIFPYVNGILEEDDFNDSGARALYQIFKASRSSNQPIEQCIPDDLRPAMTKAIELVDDDDDDHVDTAALVKESVQAATRLKRQRFVRLNKDTMYLIREATAKGDLEARRQLQQRLLEINRQIHTIDSTTHLRA